MPNRTSGQAVAITAARCELGTVVRGKNDHAVPQPSGPRAINDRSKVFDKFGPSNVAMRIDHENSGVAVLQSVVMKTLAFCLACVFAASSAALAQWAPYKAPGVARTADGKVNPSAPAPRANGKPDLTGVWMPRPDPLGKPEGVENEVIPRYMIHLGIDVSPDPTAITQPEYLDLLGKRLKSQGLDDPLGRCKPAGGLRPLSLPLPTKIIQAPGVVLLLHEYDTTFRQVFTDGRPLPTDPQPTFMGYSVGRWDGDTFVVNSMGYTEQAWLDAMGHPHTEALKVTERFKRIDTGRLDVEITFDDPKALRKPVTITQHLLLQPDQDLLEYFCAENEKDAPHYVPIN